MTDAPPGIAERRARIRAADREILALVAERMRLAREIGDLKREIGQPVRDYAVEAEVIAGAGAIARELGITDDVAQDVVKRLIRESLRVQESDRRERARRERGRAGRALVVGGRGRMGRWFADFLDVKGFSVTIADVAGPDPAFGFVDDWVAAIPSFDVVCVAVPPSRVGEVLRALEDTRDALVFDIASLKSPFLKDVEHLAANGVMVTSIHPMWGPDTDLLSEKNLLLCDCGVPEATRAARALFEDTAARLVDAPVTAHDALMAYTLGLPHAVNLAFARALREGPHTFEALKHLGGPTFTKQVRVATEVVHENKDLYYEIQHLNPHTAAAYDAMRDALRELEGTTDDREAFITFMKECEAYLGEGV